VLHCRRWCCFCLLKLPVQQQQRLPHKLLSPMQGAAGARGRRCAAGHHRAWRGHRQPG
jgi:hypothetical protein